MNTSKVLVIDLDIDIKRIEPLLQEQFEVYAISDFTQAIEFIDKEEVYLTIIDLEENQKEKIKLLKQLKKTSILGLISASDEMIYHKLLSCVNVDFLKKPFFDDELLFKVYSLIKQSKYTEEIALQTKELEQYKKVLDESDIVSKSDLSGKITYVNKKFLDISGYKLDELIGKHHNIVRHPDMHKDIFNDMWKKITKKKVFKGIIKNQRKDGTPYYVDATVVPILDINGDIKEYIGVRHDITGIMSSKRQFLDEISYSNNPISIIGKIKNYTLLKEFYGETYIQKVEDFINKNIVLLVPNESPLTKVYQLENGEFGFLRECDGNNPSNIELCLKKFQNNIKFHEFVVDNKKIDIEFHFVYTLEKKDAYENLKVAMYKAQKEKIDIIFADGFASKNKTKAKNNIKIVNILKDAIQTKEKAEIVSFFQPILNNKTGKIEKYESLVRLIRDDGSIISPYFFIDIAKSAGYYKDVTNIVVQNTQKALNMTDKDITLNLSTIDIEDLEVRNILLDLIAKPENFGRIVFELLEDEVTSDFNVVKDFIGLAKVIGGVKIAIDDFGSGYSNFERLLDFQPDILKIDGSLIKNIVTDPFSKHVAEAIVLFAKKQNIQTVAEFIADEDIFNEVKKLDVDYSQGYYIGKPDILK